MTYLALYRQWRPQKLSEIVGQQHVTQTLQNALVLGKVSHAYLFCGPRGTGKTSTAKVLARAVNCSQNQRGEPCNKCRVCEEIKSDASMDVMEIDAASNRGIDEIRELKENIKYYPSLGRKRVYIIDEVHMLTNEAFNALLKTLEDPPQHVVFVLATTEPHRVPLTILSRCQRFDFRPITEDVIARRLEEVIASGGFNVSHEALQVITRAASGSLRDALSLLDQALLLSGENNTVTAETVHGILGTVQEDILNQLATGLAKKDAAAVLNLIDTVTSEGKDLYLLAGELTKYLRRILMEQLAPRPDTTEISSLSGLFSRLELVRIIDILVEAEQAMRRSVHPRVLFELALIRAIEEYRHQLTTGELIARLERLEQAQDEGTLPQKKIVEQKLPKQAVPVDTGSAQSSSHSTKQPITQSKLEEEKNVLKGNTKAMEPAAKPEQFRPVLDSPEPGSFSLRQDVKNIEKPSVPPEDFPQQREAETSDAVHCSIEQIQRWWPDILETIKKTSQAKYQFLNTKQVWPAEANRQQLILGVTRGEDLIKEALEDQEYKELLAKTLYSFTRVKWQIRCKFYDAPPPGWGEESRTSLGAEETIKLFQGEDVPLDEIQD